MQKVTLTIDRDKVLGLVRHVLTFAGGYVVAKGLATDGVMQDAVGGLTALAGMVWSYLDKSGIAATPEASTSAQTAPGQGSPQSPAGG